MTTISNETTSAIKKSETRDVHKTLSLAANLIPACCMSRESITVRVWQGIYDNVSAVIAKQRPMLGHAKSARSLVPIQFRHTT